MAFDLEIKYTIKGLSPLLMHRFVENDLSAKGRNVKNMTPKEIAEKYAYRLENGELYIPGENVYRCLIEGGQFHKYGKKMITNSKSTLLPAGCIMATEKIPLGTKDFEVDSRSAVNNAINARVMTHRPMLRDWELSFCLEIDSKFFDLGLIDNIIIDAGSKCGLGAFRPSKKGCFGRFTLVKKEIVNKRKS